MKEMDESLVLSYDVADLRHELTEWANGHNLYQRRLGQWWATRSDDELRLVAQRAMNCEALWSQWLTTLCEALEHDMSRQLDNDKEGNSCG